ncbi:MAG: ABC transporter permease subunit [Actinobacteria bacterium]|nr:ABC transporter permease subunit [Actinomycetota bacterium]
MFGLVARILILGILDALAVASIPRVLNQHDLLVTIIFFTVFIALNVVYFWPKAKASRWLAPGTTLLAIFVIIPIIINVALAGTNSATGHEGTRAEAITATVNSSLQQDDDGIYYDIVAVHKGTELGLILTNAITKDVSFGTSVGNTAIENPKRLDDGSIAPPAGWDAYGTSDADLQMQADFVSALPGQQFAIPNGGNKYIVWDGSNNPYNATALVVYDKNKDRLVDTATGYVYREANGSFIGPDGEDMTRDQSWVGWQTWVGLDNFTKIYTDKDIQSAFVKILLWNIAFAILAVFTSFVIGLVLALTLNHPRMKMRRTMRSLLIIPYAVPGIVAVSVWAGMLNDDYGFINGIFGTNIRWLMDPTWAKVSVLLVNLWMAFPYFFLITTGALQSIPAEYFEAAEVDGASPLQVLSKIKLPLLLVPLTPLMIGSLAYNFNNFMNIYLLTGGGPFTGNDPNAGDTDILLSYTWKMAFNSGSGQQFGLACAISVLIFFFIAPISIYGFKRAQSSENMS